MFTGIVEGVGTLGDLHGPTGRLNVLTPIARELHQGESIAVNGACLTVVARTTRSFSVDLSPETLAKTSFRSLAKGSRVNLERALLASGRLEGHFLQGHVDGVGSFVQAIPEGDYARYRFRFPRGLAPYLIPKGSIGIQGVSLTIAALGRRELDVALIPYTLEMTNLRDLCPGDPVNFEADMIGKYVVRYLALAGRPRGRRQADL
ncbi:MAG: riboflavin synthase [Acidobacteriota bacterium]